MSTQLANIDFSDSGLQLRTLDEALRFCKCVHESGLAPKTLDSPGAILVAIQMGAEVGMKPMQALQCIAVINGRPSIYGDGLPALGWASGKLESFREWFEGEGDNLTAVCEVKRVGSEHPHIERFSVQDAKRAKLWNKTGRNGKDTPWVTYPRRMLMWRARSWAFRAALADALGGLHIAEEVRDIPPERTSQPVDASFLDLDAEPTPEVEAPVVANLVEVPDGPQAGETQDDDPPERSPDAYDRDADLEQFPERTGELFDTEGD